MKTWAAFFPDLLVELPGCAHPVVTHALMRASQEFFQTTRAWNVWLEPIITAQGITNYSIEFEPASELVRLEAATLEGVEIAVTRMQDVRADWMSSNSGMRTCVFTPDRKNVELLPPKAAGLSLVIQACLKPSNVAVGIPDDLFDLYSETIALGAKARLMAQPGMEYSNPVFAVAVRKSFEAAMDVLKTSLWRGNAATRPRVRAHFF